jgi:ribosomal protein L35AE/L33A
MNLILAIAFTALAAGCQSRKPPMVNGPAPSEDQVTRIRASFQAQNPRTRVGVVVDILPNQNLAAIGDVQSGDFYVGETVCFIDANSNPIVCGTVQRITGDQVHVKYEAPAPGHRTPMAGDIAVAFGNSASTAPSAQP